MSSLFETTYLYQKPWSNPWHNIVTFDSAVTGGCGQWGSGHAYKLDLRHWYKNPIYLMILLKLMVVVWCG